MANEYPATSTFVSESASATEDLQMQQQLQQEAEECLQAERDLAQKKQLSRMRKENFLYDVSYYGYVASWGFLIAFLAGRIITIDIITLTGIIGSLVAVSSSMIASELLLRMHRQDHGIIGIITMIVAAGLTITGLAGLALDNADLTSAGILGLFAWSFFPSLVDFMKRQGDDYKSYEYDDDGNVIPQDDDDEASHRYVYRTSSSSGGYSVINEVFGIPQPQDPPPIEISRDDIYDEEDEKWRRYVDMNAMDEKDDLTTLFHVEATAPTDPVDGHDLERRDTQSSEEGGNGSSSGSDNSNEIPTEFANNADQTV